MTQMLSRVADSLYWMSRYLERAEHTARALDVQLEIALDEAPWSASVGWVCLLDGVRADLPMEVCADGRAIAQSLALDRSQPLSVACSIGNARENARQIRESITSEMWEEINRIYLSLRTLDIDRLWSSGTDSTLRNVHRGGQMIAGIIDSTMRHGEGWEFIRLGRFLERAMSVAWFLEAHFGVRGVDLPDDSSSAEFVAWAGLLRSCCAFEPYCKVHTAELLPPRILQFLLLDAEFSHSVRFAAEQISSSAKALAESTGSPRDSVLHRRAGRLAAELSYVTIEEVLASDLSEFMRSIVTQCAQIHDALYRQYVGYTVEAVPSGKAVEMLRGAS
ncbi:MAG: alpha-E domain-containing protein [Tepidisphaeraceae bacterium]